jgi:hypothetical protein
MEKPTRKRHTFMLALIVTLIGSAIFCGRGQPTNPAPPQPPPAGEQPPSGQPAAGVDLFASSVTVEPTGNGYEVKVAVSVSKQGDGLVTSGYTARWYPHGKSDALGCSWDFGNKVNQGEVTKTCTYTYENFGEMHWRAIVDAANDVAETDEENNILKGTTTIAKSGGDYVLVLSPPKNCEWNVASVPRDIEIRWQYTAPEDIDGFRIYQGATSLELELDADARFAVMQNLELSTQYHFDVRAYKGARESVVDACFVDATTGQ